MLVILLKPFLRTGIFIRISLFMCICIFSACDEQQLAEENKAAPEVAVVNVAAQDLPMHTELAGRVAALRVSEVRPQVDGIIEKRLFEEGADVKAGELLYQINSATYNAAVEQADANLAVAKADLTNLRLLAERYQKLVNTQSVSRHDYDLAQANYQQGLAQVKASEAALKTAQINVARTQVRAPIAGRISRSAVTEGGLVLSGQDTVLTRIQQVDPVYVDVVQSSQQVVEMKRRLANGTLKPGDSNVTLLLDDGHTYEHAGVLKFTDLNVDAETGMVILRAQFPNPNGVLLPGMYVRAAVSQGTAANVVLLPQQAVSYNDQSEPSVWVVNAQNQAEPRTLELMGRHGNQWITRTGLVDGDRVIVEGSLRVSPGATVSPVAWNDAPDTAAKPVTLVRAE